jgi:hypothetical protein
MTGDLARDDRADPGFEPDAMRLRPLVIAAAVSLLVMLASVVVARGLSRPDVGALPQAALRGRDAPALVAGLRQDLIPSHDAVAQRAAAGAALSRYGWTDRAHGLVRIPIERAIELAADGRLREMAR